MFKVSLPASGKWGPTLGSFLCSRLGHLPEEKESEWYSLWRCRAFCLEMLWSSSGVETRSFIARHWRGHAILGDVTCVLSCGWAALMEWIRAPRTEKGSRTDRKARYDDHEV
eukprot:6457697-Amphidinium_carterae.1